MGSSMLSKRYRWKGKQRRGDRESHLTLHTTEKSVFDPTVLFYLPYPAYSYKLAKWWTPGEEELEETKQCWTTPPHHELIEAAPR